MVQHQHLVQRAHKKWNQCSRDQDCHKLRLIISKPTHPTMERSRAMRGNHSHGWGTPTHPPWTLGQYREWTSLPGNQNHKGPARYSDAWPLFTSCGKTLKCPALLFSPSLPPLNSCSVDHVIPSTIPILWKGKEDDGCYVLIPFYFLISTDFTSQATIGVIGAGVI